MRVSRALFVCACLVCAAGCASAGPARGEGAREQGVEHAELLRDADAAIVASAYAVATIDIRRLKARVLERERGLLAPRRNGRLAWQDLGAWTQERYGVNVDAFDALTLVVAPETGVYVIGRGEVDAAALTGDQRTIGGSLSLSLIHI